MRRLQKRGTGNPALSNGTYDGQKADRAISVTKFPFGRHRQALLVGVALMVVLIDQVTKTIAENQLAKKPFHIVGPIQLRLEFNSGAAFSIGRGLGPALAVVAILAVVIIWFTARRSGSSIVLIASGLVAGGAMGNLSDRIFRHNSGSVIDFVYTKYWPTFNVADSCITIGVVLLAWSLTRKPSQHESGEHQTGLDSDPTRSRTERHSPNTGSEG